MLMTDKTPTILKMVDPKPAKEEEQPDDKKVIRNALIEGVWGITVFMAGATALQMQTEPINWVYGAIGSFMTGCVGYLVKAYRTSGKDE